MFLNHKKKHYLFIFFLMTSLFKVSPALAINPSSKLPIQIESDRATLNDETGVSNYAGNVIISQGLSRLEADNISVNARDRKIVSIKATGRPAHFVQQDDIKTPPTHGYGKTIIYITKDEILRFIGDAKLVQQDNSFSGDQIEYDIVRKAIKAQGDESIGSRVKIQYHPNPSPPEPTTNDQQGATDQQNPTPSEARPLQTNKDNTTSHQKVTPSAQENNTETPINDPS